MVAADGHAGRKIFGFAGKGIGVLVVVGLVALARRSR